jgi:hypothetical protein
MTAWLQKDLGIGMVPHGVSSADGCVWCEHLLLCRLVACPAAFDQGVIINLDDASLVQSLVNIRGRCPDLMCFRLNPGVGHTDSETVSNVLGGPASKFGVPPDQIVDAYRQAAAAGATRFGLHAMVGSCVMDDEVSSAAPSCGSPVVRTLARPRVFACFFALCSLVMVSPTLTGRAVLCD